MPKKFDCALIEEKISVIKKMLESLTLGMKELLSGKAKNEDNLKAMNSRIDELDNKFMLQGRINTEIIEKIQKVKEADNLFS